MTTTNGKFDHLSADNFWDLVYDTAKNKKKRKNTWKILMSSDYADTVRYMAENHMKRIENDVEDGAPKTEALRNAYKFIQRIRGQAIHAIETHTANEKNIRRWEDISILHDYIAYLKDAIEDLRSFVDDRDIVFDFYASPEAMEADIEVQLDDWIRKRVKRRGEDLDNI